MLQALGLIRSGQSAWVGQRNVWFAMNMKEDGEVSLVLYTPPDLMVIVLCVFSC